MDRVDAKVKGPLCGIGSFFLPLYEFRGPNLDQEAILASAVMHRVSSLTFVLLLTFGFYFYSLPPSRFLGIKLKLSGLYGKDFTCGATHRSCSAFLRQGLM